MICELRPFLILGVDSCHKPRRGPSRLSSRKRVNNRPACRRCSAQRRTTLPSAPKKVTRGNGAVTGTPGASERLIVIGFVGGFARHDDQKHPEVQFAESLRERYRSKISADVFGNVHGRDALRLLLRLLDSDENGNLCINEKQRARIVLFGHSWGAAETLVFAGN